MPVEEYELTLGEGLFEGAGEQGEAVVGLEVDLPLPVGLYDQIVAGAENNVPPMGAAG
jgi:hypothetical protein